MDLIQCEFVMKKLYEAGITPEHLQLINLMEFAYKFDIFLSNNEIVHIVTNY